MTLRLLYALLCYRSRLARPVQAQMCSWRATAQVLADSEIRTIALCKLDEESFNAAAAAMAATAAPSAHRGSAARAIVALELLFDCLDGLTERPLPDPLRDGERLHAPLIDCFATAYGSASSITPHVRRRDRSTIEGYLGNLAQEVRGALALLPANESILNCARSCAVHASEAQVRMHAASSLGRSQIEIWARRSASAGMCATIERRLPPGAATRPWREFAASAACSVLALHALIAAAADPATRTTDARRLLAAYMPLCAAVTLLDGLIDAQQDEIGGKPSYAGLYDTPEQLANALRRTTDEAKRSCATLPHAKHHEMIAASALAYEISSADGRSDAPAAAILQQLVSEHRTTLRAPLSALRAWRALRGTHARRRHQTTGSARGLPRPDIRELRPPAPFAHTSRERSFTC